MAAKGLLAKERAKQSTKVPELKSQILLYENFVKQEKLVKHSNENNSGFNSEELESS